MKYIKYPIFVFITVLLLAEGLLRMMGYQPGILLPPAQIKKLAFNFTDSLYLTQMLLPDSNGIMMINPKYDSASFDRDVARYNFSPVLKKMVRRNLFNVPINSNGFQDEEFSSKDTFGKKKILLLGDSFTWGYSADSIKNSFANLLGAEEGYATYNLGLAGTDPATYLKLAQTYIPKIHPHYVIVNFTIANDFLFYRKKLKPFTYTDLYPTNAGAFFVVNTETIGKDSIELFDTYLDSYNYTAGKFTWRGEQNICFRMAIKYSALLSQIMRITKGYYTPHVQSTHVPTIDCTREYLSQIDSICQANHVQFILAVINSGKNNSAEEIKKCRDSFGNIPFYMPDKINESRYYIPPPDGHFNTLGHWKYEQFLLRILQRKEETR